MEGSSGSRCGWIKEKITRKGGLATNRVPTQHPSGAMGDGGQVSLSLTNVPVLPRDWDSASHDDDVDWDKLVLKGRASDAGLVLKGGERGGCPWPPKPRARGPLPGKKMKKKVHGSLRIRTARGLVRSGGRAPCRVRLSPFPGKPVGNICEPQVQHDLCGDMDNSGDVHLSHPCTGNLDVKQEYSLANEDEEEGISYTEFFDHHDCSDQSLKLDEQCSLANEDEDEDEDEDEGKGKGISYTEFFDHYDCRGLSLKKYLDKDEEEGLSCTFLHGIL